jgi:hypothetical protein
MILLVDLQVLREMVHASGEERDLHLGRAGIGLVEAVLGDRGGRVRHASLKPCDVGPPDRLIGTIQSTTGRSRSLRSGIPLTMVRSL